MITVIGLGLYKDDLSFRAEKFLEKAKNIYVKTAKTPTYDFFEKNGISAKSFDDAYDAAEDFSELDEKIIKTLLSENEKGDVAFCVNGGGFDDGIVIAQIVGAVTAHIVDDSVAVDIVYVRALRVIHI